MIMMMDVDLSGADLRNMNCDDFTLQNLLNCRRHGAILSEDTEKRLDLLKPGNYTAVGV
jgi:uncharacterized protein YjbI with pentapeptide repeats